MKKRIKLFSKVLEKLHDGFSITFNRSNTVHLVAKYFGILTEEEYQNLRNNPTTSPFQESAVK